MEQQTLQLKITLDQISPPIWRRVLVSNNEDLYDLHIIIQILFKWEGYHLHEFKIKNVHYGEPDEEFDLFTIHDELDYKLKDFNFKAGSKFSYKYDFGDNWKHTILVEKVLPFDKAQKLPFLVGGKRAAPPEDVGGSMGYERFLEIIKDSDNAEYQDMINWVGGFFDPEFFHQENTEYWLDRLTQKRAEWNARRSLVYEDPAGWLSPEVSYEQFARSLTKEDEKIIDEIPIRKDVINFLNYINQQNIIGTPSSGNLTQKAVREVAALLENPPELIQKVNKRTFTFKNEGEVWPVYFVHLIAFNAFLIEGGKGRKWKLTEFGEDFLGGSKLIQLYILFTGWWFHGDWLVTLRGNIILKFVPPSFQRLMHFLLMSSKPGEIIHLDDISSIIKNELGYYWDSSLDNNYFSLFNNDLDKTVMQPLEAFGIIKTNREPFDNFLVNLPFSTFQLTPFGRKILASFSVGYDEQQINDHLK